MITDRHKQLLLLDDRAFTREEVLDKVSQGLTEMPKYEEAFWHFLREWFDDRETVRVTTSGSTGAPKTMLANKQAMIESAKRSCSALGLHRDDRALISMNMKFIGAKMMVVRALLLGMSIHLVPPSRDPFVHCDDNEFFDFLSMVPMQAQTALDNPRSEAFLERARVILLGGSFVDEELADQLRRLPGNVYSSYGMTETLSHIALRRVNGPEASAFYTPIADVTLRRTDNGALALTVPYISSKELITNDMVELDSTGRFRVLGRVDNVINSGGIKLQVEEIEKALSGIVTGDYAITALKHPLWGEEVVLLSTVKVDEFIVKKAIEKKLSPYHVPKEFLVADHIPRNDNGKIERGKLKRLAELIHTQMVSIDKQH